MCKRSPVCRDWIGYMVDQEWWHKSPYQGVQGLDFQRYGSVTLAVQLWANCITSLGFPDFIREVWTKVFGQIILKIFPALAYWDVPQILEKTMVLVWRKHTTFFEISNQFCLLNPCISVQIHNLPEESSLINPQGLVQLVITPIIFYCIL